MSCYMDAHDHGRLADSEYISRPKKKTCNNEYFRRKAVYDRLSKNFNQEELDFFYECKKVFGDRKTYGDFLRLLDLFSQDCIKMSTLIEKVGPPFSKSPRLFEYFKSLIFYKGLPQACKYGALAATQILDRGRGVEDTT